MLLAFALTARGEIETAALGSNWRIWQLLEKGTNGIGIEQTSAFTSEAGQTCRRTRVWLITWRPTLRIEPIAYDGCDASAVRRVTVARVRPSAIIALSGGGL